ncbi:MULTISPECIES: TetR/AcrR family transcriptional regulator [unclassified Bradyrhizobium]|uniref:TetR/AcrR family transcriptional regulator n=1 Tax=unclassified Bradyrhizobium TaxID=2631580 RepID=UPI002FEF5DD6
MRRSAAQTRLHILDAAYGLFWRQGFLRVSMDAIAARAGITKRALYQHFRSKDALMAATLAYSSELVIERLRQFQKPVTTGDELIESYFAQLREWAKKPKYSGGGFTRAVVELADLRGHPARAIARKHKSAVEQWLADELASTGILSPGDRAREIMLLTEGAMALMLIHGDPGWANSAAQAAKRLLQTRQALASHRR